MLVLADPNMAAAAADEEEDMAASEYLLLRGWCVPWVPGDSNEDPKVVAMLDSAVEKGQERGEPQRRCGSAEEQTVGAEWLGEVLAEAAPRLLDIAVRNDDMDMFVALRPWSEKLRRTDLLNATACRDAWLKWTVTRDTPLRQLWSQQLLDLVETTTTTKNDGGDNNTPPAVAPIAAAAATSSEETNKAAAAATPAPILCAWFAAVALLVVMAAVRK